MPFLKELRQTITDLDPQFGRKKREKAVYANAVVRTIKFLERGSASYGFKYVENGEECPLKKRTTMLDKFWHLVTLLAVTIQCILYFKWQLLAKKNHRGDADSLTLWRVAVLYFTEVYFFCPMVGWVQSLRTNDMIAMSWYPLGMEKYCWNVWKGKPGHVKPMVICAHDLLIFSYVFSGILFTLLPVMFPCFPTVASNHFIDCASWDSQFSGSRLLLIPFGIWEGHNWCCIWAHVDVSLSSGLFYPAELAALWVRTIKKEMEDSIRNLSRPATAPNPIAAESYISSSLPSTSNPSIAIALAQPSIFPASASTPPPPPLLAENLSPPPIMKYRHLQILFNRVNALWAAPGLYAYFGAFMFAFITSAFAVVKLNRTLPLPVTFFFSVISLDVTAAIHFIFYLLSQPYLKSVDFLRFANWKVMLDKGKEKKSGRMNKKWSKTFLRSCAPIQVNFGGGNFFDRLTAMNMWQFCVDRLIGLILLTNINHIKR